MEHVVKRRNSIFGHIPRMPHSPSSSGSTLSSWVVTRPTTWPVVEASSRSPQQAMAGQDSRQQPSTRWRAERCCQTRSFGSDAKVHADLSTMTMTTTTNDDPDNVLVLCSELASAYIQSAQDSVFWLQCLFFVVYSLTVCSVYMYKGVYITTFWLTWAAVLWENSDWHSTSAGKSNHQSSQEETPSSCWTREHYTLH